MLADPQLQHQMLVLEQQSDELEQKSAGLAGELVTSRQQLILELSHEIGNALQPLFENIRVIRATLSSLSPKSDADTDSLGEDGRKSADSNSSLCLDTEAQQHAEIQRMLERLTIIQASADRINQALQQAVSSSHVKLAPLVQVIPKLSHRNAKAPLPDLSQIRMAMITDDEQFNRDIYRDFLKQLGVNTIAAIHGGIAVALYQANPFDLIIMDIQMPIMDGLEATRQIRLLEAARPAEGEGVSKRPPTPIICISAYPLEDYESKALEAGVNVYLKKPVSFPVFRDALVRCCAPTSVIYGETAAAGEQLTPTAGAAP